VEDPDFLVDHHDHLSAKGWMYYNRALDEFFHTDPALLEAGFANRPPQAAPQSRQLAPLVR
jgi:poly-D-alanine transfer protein DltD